MRRPLLTAVAASMLSACVATVDDQSSSSVSSSSAAPASSSSAPVSSAAPSSSSQAVVSSSSVASSSSEAGLTFPAGSASRGETLYKNTTYGCETCHGVEGAGGITNRPIDPAKTMLSHSTAGVSVGLEEFIYRYMPSPDKPGQCNEQCSADIAAYIRSWANNSSAANSSSSQGASSSEPLTFKGTICDDRITYAARQLKLLTRFEYQNSVEDLVGIDFEVGKDLPDDTYIHGFSNNLGASVTEVHVDSYLAAAERVAAWSRANNYQGVVNCNGLSAAACADAILDGFAKRAFRRPAKENERIAIHDLFDDAYTDGDVNNGVEMAITAILSSPGFLYRSEQGEAVSSNEYDGSQYEFSGPTTTLLATDFTDKRQYVAGTEPGALIIGDTTNNQTAKLGKHISFTGEGTRAEVTLRAVRPANDGATPTLRAYVGSVSVEIPITWSDFRTISFYFPGLSGHREFAFEKYSDTTQIEVLDFTYGEGSLIPNAPDLDAFKLTSYEVATYLAYTFTGSTPDAELMAAADAGELETKAQITAQVDRLLASPRAKELLGNFVTQWLGTDKALSEAKDPAKYPEINENLRKAMVQEVRELFAHVVLDDSQTIEKFFAADYTFVNKTLADHYGLGGATGDNFVKVNSGANRGGVLTTAAFMTAYGNNDETSPIRRAGAVRERLLCHDIPPPPPGVVVDREAAAAELATKWEAGSITNRERYHELTIGESCQACHREIINPLGFGMEDFDTIGRYQTTDRNGITIDASGTLYGIGALTDGQTLAFNGAKDLSHQLAGLDAVKQCFAKNLFRFALGTGTLEIDEDNEDLGHLTDQEKTDYACSVRDVTAAMIDLQDDPKQLLKELGALQLVRYRKELNR